jgi:Zn finger protein HypA/HybF involved in hydrogenase expression
MHDGCSGSFLSGKQIVDKIRMMGFNKNLLAAPLKIDCFNCDTIFQMETMKSQCPACNRIPHKE